MPAESSLLGDILWPGHSHRYWSHVYFWDSRKGQYRLALRAAYSIPLTARLDP